MGWASGSRLLDEVAEIVMKHVPAEFRADVAEQLIDTFESEDCDTVYECDQPDIRAAYERMNQEPK